MLRRTPVFPSSSRPQKPVLNGVKVWAGLVPNEVKDLGWGFIRTLLSDRNTKI
jgi:hypothetical protein